MRSRVFPCCMALQYELPRLLPLQTRPWATDCMSAVSVRVTVLQVSSQQDDKGTVSSSSQNAKNSPKNNFFPINIYGLKGIKYLNLNIVLQMMLFNVTMANSPNNYTNVRIMI